MSFRLLSGIGLLLVFGGLLVSMLPRWSYEKGWWREPSTVFGGFLMVLLIVEMMAT